jgi:hypothetical protein
VCTRIDLAKKKQARIEKNREETIGVVDEDDKTISNSLLIVRGLTNRKDDKIVSNMLI